MKMLSLPTEPRQAALAGAGIASPRNAGEALRNPIAGATANSPVLSFSRTEFSSLTGASRISMLAGSTFGSWNLTAGMESLNYDRIQGYTEDGLTSDGQFFTAGTMAAQLGIARNFNSMSAGLTARFANQNIDDHHLSGFLFDGGVKYNLLKYFEFGAIFNNLGWIDSDTKEIAPLSVQAGITASYALPLGFTGAISADLYRRNDSAQELRTGIEIMYLEILSLRLGYYDVISAGFAIKFNSIAVEYAYQNKEVLGANHIFGVSLYF